MMVTSGLFGTFGGGQALAQGGATTFVSPMTGIPITTSGPWTVDTTSVMSQDGIESVTLMAEFEFMQVWFMPGNVDLVEARDVVLDSYAQTFGTFVEIDRGAYGNVSYSLDITSSEGVEFGVFSLFLGQRESGFVEYYVYFGAISLFAQGFASAQQNVTVNNTPVFEGVDGAGLQNLLLANAGVTGSSPSTTQAPPPPTDPQQPQQPQQPTQPAEQPAQPTPPPATTGEAPASPDGTAYIQSLQGEIAYLEGTVNDFLNNYMLMDTNAEAAVPELNRVAGEWAAYPQRASSIVAPAGFETVDASYRAVAAEAEALAVLWDGVIQSAQAQDGTTGTKMADLVLRVMSFQVMIDDLETQLSTAGGSTTTTTDTPAQPTQPPADTTTQQTGGLSAEQMAYVQTVRSEISMLETSMDDFQTTFTAYIQGTAPNTDQAVQEINAAVDMWSAYPQTASTIVAPAGLEDVDAAYQGIATSISTAAGTFRSAIQAGADGDSAGSQALMQDFVDQLGAVYTQIDNLNALLDQYEQAGSTTTTTTDTTTQPTAEAQPTQETTTTTTTGGGDGDAYVATISGETQSIMDTIVSFAEGIQLLGSTDTAEQDQGAAQINDAVAYWRSYDQVAAGIVAPAGYEDVDAAYRQLASDVTQLATLFDAWLGAPEASRAAAGEEFSAALDSVQVQIEDINAMLGGGSTGSTSTTTTTTTTETETGTETEEGSDEPTDTTETGNRGQLPEFPGQGGEEQDTGSTSSADVEDLGLVSDTEYVSPQFGIEVVWDDRWVFDSEYLEQPIGTDEENGEDWITLVWGGGTGGDITVAVSELDDFEPAQIIEYWESDEYVDQFEASGEVLLAESSDDRGAVLILLDDGEEGIVIYREAVCLSPECDQVAFIMVVSSVVDASDVIADAEEGIEIEGETATGMFSTREINRALDQ